MIQIVNKARATKEKVQLWKENRRASREIAGQGAPNSGLSASFGLGLPYRPDNSGTPLAQGRTETVQVHARYRLQTPVET